jgi:hypothetical protein
MIRAAILFIYERLVVALAVLVIVLHVSDVHPAVVYVITPALLVFWFGIMGRFVCFVYDMGVWGSVRTFVVQAYGGTIRVLGITIDTMNQFKWSKVLWSLATINLLLIVYFFVVNIDVFQIFRALLDLCVAMVQYISDPAAIWSSMDALLNKMYILDVLKYVKNVYVMEVLKGIHEGNSRVILNILEFSLVLFFLSLIPYALRFVVSVTGVRTRIARARTIITSYFPEHEVPVPSD